MARIKFKLHKKRSKYNNKLVEHEGWKFHSKLERDLYKHLQLLKDAGEIGIILRQVSLYLVPGLNFVVDFMVQYLDDRRIEFIDAKGYMTTVAKNKIKMAEHVHGIKIKIVKRGDF